MPYDLNGKRISWGLAVFVMAFCSLAAANNAASRGVEQNGCDLSYSDAKQLIAFLTEQISSRTNPPCIEYAIEALESVRSPSAVSVLVDLLDFPEPLPMSEEVTRSLINSSHYSSRYKAVEALFDIGEPAIPSLLVVLQEPATSPIKYKNALTAYLDIRREHLPEAIKFLGNTLAKHMCPSLQDAGEKELLPVLEENLKKTHDRNSNCVDFAIVRLGLGGSAAATKLLLSYLDHEWTQANSESGIPNPDHPLLYPQQRYPAVTALYLIGGPVLLQLLHTLQAPETSAIVRSKIIETIMLIYSEYPPQGIKVINSVSKKGQKISSDEAANLAAAAVHWCDIDHRVSCQAALRGTN